MPLDVNDNPTPGNGVDRPKGTIARDPEVVAIVRITGMIDNLNHEAQDRVLAFLADKYKFGEAR